MPSLRRKCLTALSVLVTIIGPLANCAAASAATVQSPLWGGYVATPKSGGVAKAFKYVQATFTVPSMHCLATPNAEVEHFAALGGWREDVLQAAGIVEGCNGYQGTQPYYYPAIWANFWPYGATCGGQVSGSDPYRPTFTINAGDTIQASVYYNLTNYDLVFTLMDKTTGQGFGKTDGTWAPLNGCDFKGYTSAEVATSETDLGNQTIPPDQVADFVQVNFSSIQVMDTSQSHHHALTSTAWKTIGVAQTGSETGLVTVQPGKLTTINNRSAFTNMWQREN